MGTPLGPKYILYSYMESLGKGLPVTAGTRPHMWIRGVVIADQSWGLYPL